MIMRNNLQVCALLLKTYIIRVFFPGAKKRVACRCGRNFRLGDVQPVYVVTKLYVSMFM